MNFLWQRRQKRAFGSKVKNVLPGTLLPHTGRLHRGFNLRFYRRSAKRFSNTRGEKYSFLSKKNSENIASEYVCLRPWCWFSSAATKHLSPCQRHKILSSFILVDHHEAVFKGYRVVANVLTYASFFSIVALSADRFLVIRLQLRYQDAVTHKRAIAGVISFWLLSAVLPLIRFLEWFPENKIFIFFVTIQFICLIISGLFYFKIFLALRQHAAQVQNVPVECGERIEAVNAARERKAAFGVFYVYLTFVACYLPPICFNIAEKIIDIEQPVLVYKVNLHATNLLVLNSSLSPLIYCWKMRRIRQAMIDVLRKPFQN